MRLTIEIPEYIKNHPQLVEIFTAKWKEQVGHNIDIDALMELSGSHQSEKDSEFDKYLKTRASNIDELIEECKAIFIEPIRSIN